MSCFHVLWGGFCYAEKTSQSLLSVLFNDTEFARIQQTVAMGQIDPLLICMAHGLRIVFTFIDVGQNRKKNIL